MGRHLILNLKQIKAIKMIQQLTDPQLYKLYGTPNKTGEGYLVQITLPYPMQLAWDTKTKVTKDKLP